MSALRTDAPTDTAAPADWSRQPERSNALALRTMSWIARRCGRRAARALLHPIALYFLLFAPAPLRHSRRFLQRALGRPPRWRERYRHLHSFIATVLDRVYLLGGRMDLFETTVRGEALIEATLAEGRGAFLVGAHMGSFEALRALGASRRGLRIAMVMYPDNARLINEALRAVAPGCTPEIIALGRVDSMLAVRDWLDGGGLAGVLADRSLPGESMRSASVRVPFLGREAVFSDGPFRLAALLRRRVVFMAALYRGGARYDVRFEALADFSERVVDAAREQRIRAATLDYVRRLEALCREQPDNWFNFHDFWDEERHGS
jgi:predicted LPLAT superfamily acyltransferase